MTMTKSEAVEYWGRKPRVKMICAECRSEDVMLDAWAEWCTDDQCWTLKAVFDEAFCEDCDGSTRLDHVRLPEMTRPRRTRWDRLRAWLLRLGS